MALCVISDLHIADGGKSDEFKQNGREGELRTFLESQPDRSVILLGDILDLLRAMLKDVLGYWGPLIDLIFRKGAVWIAGNHDAEAFSFMDSQFMGVPIRKDLILGSTFFTHGNRFDPYTKDPDSLGDTITKIEDWLVRQTNPEVGVLSRDLEAFLRGSGRYGEKASYGKMSLDFIQNFWVDEAKIKRICIGHTHQADHQVLETPGQPDLEMYNTGCWIDEHSDILKLEEA